MFDDDHVLAIFQVDGLWGSIAKSNYSGLRYREPVYRSLRELAMSYFNDYFNLRGERTLRAFSRPVNLSRFDRRNWMTTEEDLWFIPEHLVDPRGGYLVPDLGLGVAAAGNLSWGLALLGLVAGSLLGPDQPAPAARAAAA